MANVTISGLSTAATTINGADLVEIEQGGSSKKATRTVLGYAPSRTVTGSTSFTATDEVINVNTGTATITLPSATIVGRRVMVRKISASAGTVTIARAGSDTIEGKTSEILKAQWGTAIFEVVASGSWAIVELHESGTWTPEYEPETGSFTSISYGSSRYGKYTRIGNFVTISCYIIIGTGGVTVGTASGDVYITAPLSALASTTQALNVASSLFWGAGDPTEALILGGTSLIKLMHKPAPEGDSSDTIVSDMGVSNGNSAVYVSGSYFV